VFTLNKTVTVLLVW